MALVLVVLFLAVPAFAQAPPAAVERAPRHAEVTLAGCVQPEADYLRAIGLGAPASGAGVDGQFVLLSAAGVAFSLNGTRERELRSRVEQRVEITGTLEGPSADAPLEGVAGVSPLGGPAHEPGDATVPARIEGPVASAPSLQRLNMRTFRAVGGTCKPLPAQRAGAGQTTSAAPAGSKPAPVAGRGTPPQDTATVRGCVARAPDGSQGLVLTNATVIRDTAAGGTAVPGSLPSGSGSGTTNQNRGQAAGEGDLLSFQLDGQAATLATHAGSRVEIVGVIAEQPVPEPPAQGVRGTTAAEGTRLPASAPSVSHPSALLRRIAVTSVRAIGGACR